MQDERDFDCISDELLIELVKERNLNTSDLDDFTDDEIERECDHRGIDLLCVDKLEDYGDCEIQEEYDSRGLNEFNDEIKELCEKLLFALHTNKETRHLIVEFVQNITGKIVCI
jgi:hypothetical protein